MEASAGKLQPEGGAVRLGGLYVVPQRTGTPTAGLSSASCFLSWLVLPNAVPRRDLRRGSCAMR